MPKIDTYLYIFFTFLCIYMLNGVNISAIMKKNKVAEAKILVLVLSFSFSYLLTNFVMSFIS